MRSRTSPLFSSGAWRRGALAFLLAALMTPQSPYGQTSAQAAEQSLLSRRISMGVGKSTVIDLPSEASEVVVANPKIADAIVRTARQLYIVGVDAGQTTISAVGADGRQIASLEISIGRDVGELSQLLRVALPKANIVPRTVNGTIILTGTVASPAEARRAMDIAKGFTGGQSQSGAGKDVGMAGAAAGANGEQGGAVVNALTIQGEDQVMVKVTVAEVSRKVLKQLGVSAQGTGSDTLLRGGWGSLVQANPFGINTPKSDSALTLLGPNNTQATLKAFERYGVARVLAEPSITAVSGEAAKLVVGGEIPVPSQTGNCMMFGATNSLTPGTRTSSCIPGITFKQYGVTLNFLPTVMSEGRILLHLGTEVTEVDRQNSYTYADVTVPAFRTRKHETSLELPSGGSIASAGLLLEKSEQAITGLPGLMDIPILGALFRSRDYMRDETELLIIVSPLSFGPSMRRKSRGRRMVSPTPPIRRPGCWAALIASTPRAAIRRSSNNSKVASASSMIDPIGSTDFMTPADVTPPVCMTHRMSRIRRALACGLLAMLAGCGPGHVKPPPATPYDYRDRHPVVLTDTPHVVDLFPAIINGRLDYTTGGRIREFVDRYRRFGYGPVTLRRPVGGAGAQHTNASVAIVRRALVAAGFGGAVIEEDYRVTDPHLAAPLRLSFSGLKAKVAGRCGEWPTDLASGSSLEGWQNESWWNYGCATQQTLAAQIADPRDLAGPRGETPADTITRMRAIDKIREGQDPSTKWPQEEQKISKVGEGAK